MSTTRDNLYSESLQPVAECGSHNLTDAAGAPVGSPTLSGTSNPAVATPPAASAQNRGGSTRSVCANLGCGQRTGDASQFYCSPTCQRIAEAYAKREKQRELAAKEKKLGPVLVRTEKLQLRSCDEIEAVTIDLLP